MTNRTDITPCPAQDFRVGLAVTGYGWDPDTFLLVTSVGEDTFTGRDSGNHESGSYDKTHNWYRYVNGTPEP